jgi:hypothetical protein
MTVDDWLIILVDLKTRVGVIKESLDVIDKRLDDFIAAVSSVNSKK